MEPVTVSLFSLISNWLFKGGDAGKNLWKLRKPRVTLELQSFRFSGAARIPASQGVPPEGFFYELFELTITNKSNRNILINEVSCSFYHEKLGTESFTLPLPLGRGVELKPEEWKVISFEPWYWFSEMMLHMKAKVFDKNPAGLGIFLDTLDQLKIGFDLDIDSKKVVIQNKTSLQNFSSEGFSFISEGQTHSIDLGSLILREYRALKQGFLSDFHKLDVIDHGSDDREPQRFTLAILNALEEDPDLKKSMIDSESMDLEDPFNEFKDPSDNSDYLPLVELFARGGTWGQVRILKAHLSKTIESKLWESEIAGDYFTQTLREYLMDPRVSKSSTIHPDLLLDHAEFLERFQLFQYPGGVVSNMPPDIMAMLTQGEAKSSEVDSFGIPRKRD